MIALTEAKLLTVGAARSRIVDAPWRVRRARPVIGRGRPLCPRITPKSVRPVASAGYQPPAARADAWQASKALTMEVVMNEAFLPTEPISKHSHERSSQTGDPRLIDFIQRLRDKSDADGTDDRGTWRRLSQFKLVDLQVEVREDVFPGDPSIWETIDRAYDQSIDALHQCKDLDLYAAAEALKVASRMYVRDDDVSAFSLSMLTSCRGMLRTLAQNHASSSRDETKEDYAKLWGDHERSAVYTAKSALVAIHGGLSFRFRSTSGFAHLLREVIFLLDHLLGNSCEDRGPTADLIFVDTSGTIFPAAAE